MKRILEIIDSIILTPVVLVLYFIVLGLLIIFGGFLISMLWWVALAILPIGILIHFIDDYVKRGKRLNYSENQVSYLEAILKEKGIPFRQYDWTRSK